VGPPGIQLRRATIDDAPLIAPVHLACWFAAYSGLVPQQFLEDLARQDRVQRWRQRLARCDDVTTVACIEGTVVGLATAGPSGDPYPLPGTELHCLYVDATFHGAGVAQQLIEASLGHRAASLWVFEGNTRARAFYGKTGWQPTGDRRIDPGTGIPEIRLVRDAATPPVTT
jgi:GNAT superfamily N-acetyltransferase